MADSDAIIHQIGETAGAVWGALAEHGPLSLTKLLKVVGQPRDSVLQAVGWLAREGKINIVEERRNRILSLR
jgi:hypothetical protein